MAIGERIRFFRSKTGMTQKLLGVKVGFPSKTADVRLAQYESGVRTPKSDLTEALANAFGVSTMALNTPDIDTELGLMHTLFAIEDIYGLTIDRIDGEICIRLDKSRGAAYASLYERFLAWQKEHARLQCNAISKEEYDRWRYTYPEVETQRAKASLSKNKINEE